MGEFMRTGVQFAINIAVFKLLKMNSVYPVANEEKLSDKKGRVLPDLILMKDGSTVTDLANEIHSDLQRKSIKSQESWDIDNMLLIDKGAFSESDK